MQQQVMVRSGMAAPQVIYPAATTSVIVQPTPNSAIQPIQNRYASQQSMGLGIVQILCGLVAVAFNIGLIAIDAKVSYIGYGIWSGIFFIIAGSLGVGAAKNPTSCTLTSHMVLSIVAACFSVLLLSFAAVGSSEDGEPYGEICRYFGTTCRDEAKYGLNVALVVLALVELVCSIWASAICCAGLCCYHASVGTVITPAQQIQYTTTNPVHLQQMPLAGQQQFTYHQHYQPSGSAVPPYNPAAQMQAPPAYEQQKA